MQIKSTNIKKISLVIVSIILLFILFRFIFPLFGKSIIIPVSLLTILFTIGFGVGKYLPKISWIVLTLPAIPWIYYWWTEFAGSRNPNKGLELVVCAAGLILYLFVFIGFRFGVRAAKRKDTTTKIIISE